MLHTFMYAAVSSRIKSAQYYLAHIRHTEPSHSLHTQTILQHNMSSMITSEYTQVEVRNSLDGIFGPSLGMMV